MVAMHDEDARFVIRTMEDACRYLDTLKADNAHLKEELTKKTSQYKASIQTRMALRDALRKSREEQKALRVELLKLQEWQQIILGTGLDREAVIRMAATKYTETAITCWRDEVERLKVELAQAKKDLEDARMVQL